VLFVGDGVVISASAHHSITCRVGKEFERKRWKIKSAKVYITNDEIFVEFSASIILVRYTKLKEFFLVHQNNRLVVVAVQKCVT
jgi:hypothetical protein